MQTVETKVDEVKAILTIKKTKKNSVNKKYVEVEKISYNKNRLADIFARKIVELRKVANDHSAK